MRVISLAAFTLVATLGARGRAQAVRPERSVSLREAITWTLHGNPALAAASIDVDIGDAAIRAARGLDDPILEGSARWVDTRQQLVAGTPVQQPSFDDLSGAVGLTQPLATGGRVGVRLSTEYSRTDFATQSATDPAAFDRQSSEVYAPAAQLVLEHSLLRGMGVGVARADRRRASARRDVAGLAREATAAAVLRDAIGAYWDLSLAAEELQIRRASADSAREQLQRVKADIDVGKEPPSASAEVEVAIARRDDLVLTAGAGLVERSLDLERVSGRPIDQDSATLVAADRLVSAGSGHVALDEALAAAMAQNPQLRAAEAQGRAAAIEVDVTRNGLLPELDFSLAGGPAGHAADASTAYRELAKFRGYSVMANLIFQEPLGRHAARGASDAAQSSLQKTTLNATDIRQQIAAAVVRAAASVDAAARRADVLARSTDVAELDLTAEKARFESGRSTNFDVLRRQDQLAEVKLAALRARADQQRAFAAVEALTGGIFAHYGVRVR